MKRLTGYLLASLLALASCTAQPMEPERLATANVAAVTTVHSGNLEATHLGTSRATRGDRWLMLSYGTYVHDENEQPVEGAVVRFSIDVAGGPTFTASCTTAADGGCGAASSIRVKGNPKEATVTVLSIAYAGATYDASANHDTDGDSDGTTITVPV